MIGVKSTNAMIALIYAKQFKITSSTNKRFSSGELTNFVQVDANKLALLSQTLPTVMKLPILLIICFVVLFIYLGWSFLAGVAVFLVAFFINAHLGRASAKLQKQYMKK
jgi:ABC-type transport system involved in cytochrome bd biosynthesis fused ATPase/permease subunit